jgi:hypothetical protein
MSELKLRPPSRKTLGKSRSLARTPSPAEAGDGVTLARDDSVRLSIRDCNYWLKASGVPPAKTSAGHLSYKRIARLKAHGNPPFAIYSDAQAELALGREGWGTRKTEREAQTGMPAPRKDGDAKKAPGPPTEKRRGALGYNTRKTKARAGGRGGTCRGRAKRGQCGSYANTFGGANENRPRENGPNTN